MVFSMFKTPEKPVPGKSADSLATDAKVTELTETLQRVQADFENYRKRSQNEATINYTRGKAAAFKDMLSILDTLDSAIANEKNGTRHALENIRTHMLHTLSQNGVKPIHTLGKIFDPFTSECLLQGHDSQKEEDVVLEELQRGYFFHDDVLRPAKVKVNKRMGNENSHANEIRTTEDHSNQLNKNLGGTNHE